MVVRYFQIAVNIIICYYCAYSINDELKFFDYNAYWLLRHDLINSLLWILEIILLAFSLMGIFINLRVIANKYHRKSIYNNLKCRQIFISHKIFGIILILVSLTILLPQLIPILKQSIQVIRENQDADLRNVYIAQLKHITYFMLPLMYGAFLYIDGYKLIKNWPQQQV
jgi:hypothetical protein